MANSLIIPRCEVLWGNINLTSYPLSPGRPPEAIVFDVRVSLQESGETPSASLKWNPTGAAFAVYEKLLKDSLSQTITVRFFYLEGRSITFTFLWAGQTEVYGKDMSLEVKLVSQLDGLVNANIKSTAQVNDQKGLFTKTVSDLSKSFGVADLGLIVYSPQAELNLKTPGVLSNYSVGETFTGSVKNLAEQTGHMVMSTNITSPEGNQKAGANLVVLGPYASDKQPIEEPSPTSQFPDPRKRYGFFLGPGIINTITKTSEWQPPQKTQTRLDNVQQKVQPPNSTTQSQPKPTNPQTQQDRARESSRKKGGASNTSGSRSRRGVRLEDNKDGEQRKIEMQQERSSKLSASLFMCPALTGIKPSDIIFISNYSGTFLEDWLVNSVEYSQSDGGVEVSIQASRQYGLGNLMNQTLGKPWAEIAKAKGLVGGGGTLEAWQEYAWGSLGIRTKTSANSSKNVDNSRTSPSYPSGSSSATTGTGFSAFAKPFGDNQTVITDKGFYDWLLKNTLIESVNGSAVFSSPLSRVQQLYELYLKGR